MHIRDQSEPVLTKYRNTWGAIKSLYFVGVMIGFINVTWIARLIFKYIMILWDMLIRATGGF